MDQKTEKNIVPSKIIKTPERANAVARLLSVLAVFAMYYLIQYLTEVFAIYPHLNFQDDWWVKAFDHHFVQLTCALIAIWLFSRGYCQNWGLNLRNYKESIRILKRFLLYYGTYFIGIGFIVQLFYFPAPTITEDLTLRNVMGRLAFGFLFVGVSEEILFRGLFHSFLALYWVNIIRWRSIEIPVAGIIAAIVFTIAHINFNITPFEITHLYVPQLAMAFALGLFYSWAYHRTGSLLAPILAHNLSNGLLWLSEYIIIWWHT